MTTRRPAGWMLALLPLTTLGAQAVEDEAHRLDRERTQALNRDAGAIAAGRDDVGTARAHEQALRDYGAAHAAYQRRMAEWRARVAACEAGDWSACDTR